MKMTFRGKEDIMMETIQAPQSETWYRDLKDVSSIELPEKALVVAGMSLYWRMEREDKPLYMEGDKSKIWDFHFLFLFPFVFFLKLFLLSFLVVSLYVVAYKRENRKMTTVPKRVDEELWYLQIVNNFALLQDKDLAAQHPTGAGTCQSSVSWCDYVVVSDILEGLAPVVVNKPKAEPQDTADIPASNPDDPIDLESSPEPLVKTKTVKRKQVEVEAEAQPAEKVPKRKIGKRGNLDAFIAKPPPALTARAEPSSFDNDDLPPSPPRASIREQLEGTKVVEDEAEKVADVVDSETVDVDATLPNSPEGVARDPEKGKSIREDPVIIVSASVSASTPVNIEKSPAGDQGSFARDKENSAIRPKETPRDYYYRT
ncbi:hypothetical protein Hdeb2414_s0113g00798891 [Helianthus debilis subsp. tardiflorus]